MPKSKRNKAGLPPFFSWDFYLAYALFASEKDLGFKLINLLKKIVENMKRSYAVEDEEEGEAT